MTSPDQGMPQEAPPAPGQSGSNVVAILGLIGAIIGLVMCWLPFVGLVIAVIGLILSIVGMKGAAVKGGKGVAIAGLVVAILGTLLGGGISTCTVLAAASVHEAAQKAGFKGFGDMMKAASEIPKQQEAAAKAAGYSSFAEWMQKDPKAASAAAEKIQEKFGNRIQNDANKAGQTGSGSGN